MYGLGTVSVGVTTMLLIRLRSCTSLYLLVPSFCIGKIGVFHGDFHGAPEQLMQYPHPPLVCYGTVVPKLVH